MQRQNQYFTGLDIGTTAVRCVVGQLNEQDIAPTIIGVGVVSNLGVRKGSVANIEDTVAAIDGAIEAAERMAGHEVTSATVNINGAHIVGMNSKGVVAISSNSREIGQADIARVEEAATLVQLPVNREIIQVFAREYRLDGQDGIKDPIGMTGVRLEVDAHVVTAATSALRNLEKAMDASGTTINYRLLASLAAAEAVLNRDQRENGVVVIDFGASTTNIAVFEEGDVQHVAVIPAGSHNITNDLAIGLRTELDVAEAVKLHFADESAKSKGKKSAKTLTVKVGGETYTFLRREVRMIVNARLEEIFELVDDELEKINKSGNLPGGAVLVGGGSRLAGIDEFVRRKLRLPARVSKPHGFAGLADKVDSPEFATVIGLMLYDMHADGAGSVGGVATSVAGGMKSISRGVMNFLRRFVP